MQYPGNLDYVDLEDLLEVGTVAKAHGTAGEVVVRLIITKQSDWTAEVRS